MSRGRLDKHGQLLLLALFLLLHTSLATFTYPYNHYNCDDPGIPENGNREGDEFTVNATVSFSCNSGHVLHGSKSITCEQGIYEAFWSDDAPVCIPISEGSGRSRSNYKCGKPPGPGSHAEELPSSNNTVVQYQCHGNKDDHVEVSGDRVVYCYNKMWYGDPLECKRKANCQPQEPNQYIISKMSGTKENDIVLFACEKGYMLLGSSDVTCLSTGEWSSEWPSCDPVICPYPSSISNGRYHLTTSTEARYNCNTGYTLVGEDLVCCNSEKKWIPEAPSCKPVDCGPLDNPANGRVQVSFTTYRSRAYYYCNKGYDRIGSFGRTCASNGQWVEEETICQPKTCGNPTIPTNGDATISKQTVGGVTNYSCAYGYRLYGVSIRTCTTSGVWSGSPPSCIAIDCGDLKNPVGGTVVVTNTRFDSVATYNCARGKDRVGVATRTCQADGTWSDQEPQCVLTVDCGEPENIENGEASYSSTTLTSSANYSCNNGYTLVGYSASLICNKDGKWEGQLPACAAIDCGHPPTIENGQATFSSTNFTSVATYTCNKGHDLKGDGNIIVCQANGQWKEALATCVEINCGDPPNVPKAIPAYNSTLFLSKVSYSCLPGYTLSGSGNSLVCQANSQWFGHVPSCIANDCGIPESIDNGDVSYPSTTLSSIAVYDCNTGYTLVGTNDSVVCNENGQWTGPTPTCTVDCGLLDPPNNTTLVTYPDNSTLVNSTAQYFCRNGYVLPTNATTRVCNENGSWSLEEPVCQPIDCGTLPSPDNGSVRHSVSTTLSSPVRYSCKFGFRLVGMEFRLCLVNGSWSGAAPTCEIIDCGSLNNPDNGRVEMNFTIFTSRAVYSCNQGYMISPAGAATERFCRIDGTWGGEEPTCQLIDCGGLTSPANGKVDVSSTLHMATSDYSCNTGYELNGPDTRTCGDNGKWSGKTPSCELVNCGDPGILVNGQRTFFGTSYRQVATFTCNEDFTMVGDGARRCEANGKWTGEIPKCIATVPHCGLPESTENGYFVLQATIPGSKVMYGCDDGFELIGSDTRTCGTNEQWSGSAPRCIRITTCPRLDTPAFSRRVGESREIGSVVYFICGDDYDTIGSNARLCQENREWSGTQPTCILRNASCVGNGSMLDSRGRECDCVNGSLVNCCRSRRDWLSLSTEEKAQYIQAVLQASSHQLYQPFYENLMQLYSDATGTDALSFVPSTSQFLPWHRYFLQQYEDLLRLINPSVSLPYWDWTLFSNHPFTNPIFSPQTGFGNSSDSDDCVQDGPFKRDSFFVSSVSGEGCLQREYQEDSILLTRDQLAEYVLPATMFQQFFSLLTVPYISIRCAVGGVMCVEPNTVPPDDPLHILVLSYFDSVWDRWQEMSSVNKLQRYGNDNTPLALTNGFTASDYNDNSNLPNDVSVCYTEPLNTVTNMGNKKRSASGGISYVSEDILRRLSLSDSDVHSLKAANRLLYTYIAR